MKIFPKLSLFFILLLILQGSGYVGEKPNINDYFQDDRAPVDDSDGFISPYGGYRAKVQEPPDSATLKKELAPANLTYEQRKLLYPAKRPAYYGDLFVMKDVLQKLKASVKSPDIQNFGACINVQKFYMNDFLAKYKNSPLAHQEVYREIKDINSYAQSIVVQWRVSQENIKFVSYSSCNGAYQPSNIRGKLIILDKKLAHVDNLIKALE